MTSSRFQGFTSPLVLGRIPAWLLGQFFDTFKADLLAKNCGSPSTPPGTEAYCYVWAAMLSKPEMLPYSLVQAMDELADLTGPDDLLRLESAVGRARAASASIDTSASRETQALQLWFWRQSLKKNETTVIGHQLLQPLPTAGSPPPASLEDEPEVGTEERGEEAQAMALEQERTTQSDISVNHQPLVAPAQRDGELVPRKSDEGGSTLEPPITECSPLAAQPEERPKARTTESAAGAPPPEHRRVLPSWSHRHTGKVARLPNEVRETINRLIRDGLPYATILAQLGEVGQGLNRHNLKSWRKGGFLEWEQKQERTASLRAKEQFALEILREEDGDKLQEAVLQITAAQLTQLLADFDPTVMGEKLKADPQNFIRLLALLPKLSASGLHCQSHRLEAKERAATKAKPPRLGLSTQARDLIEEKFFDPPAEGVPEHQMSGQEQLWTPMSSQEH